MRYDTQPARLTSVVGGVHADGAGDSIWARRTKQTDGLLDASPLITYNLTGDGSGVWASAPGHVNVDVNTTTFASSGVDIFNSTSYELYFGALLAPQSAAGVFLNPQGVLNAASFAPPGYPISPGGVMTLYRVGISGNGGDGLRSSLRTQSGRRLGDRERHACAGIFGDVDADQRHCPVCRNRVRPRPS